MLSMASIIASRLILNLRGYARSPCLDSNTLVTAANPTSMSAHIDFVKSESKREEMECGETEEHHSFNEIDP